MTVLFPCGRTLSKQGLPTTSRLFTRSWSGYSVRRVVYPLSTSTESHRTFNHQSPISAVFNQVKTYATETAAAPKSKGRPKGSKTAKSTITAVKKSTTAKRSVVKKPTTRKTATKRTPTKRKTKVKAKPKPKPKAKPKKRVLSEKGIARQASKDRTELKKKALLGAAPKRLPETAWQVCFTEEGPKKGDVFGGDSAKRAGQVFRNAAPEDKERFNHTANQNKTKNERAHKDWLKTFTPAQIKEANHARDLLRKQARATGSKKLYIHIQDDRLVKQPGNAYSYFLQDRFQSGDFKHMVIAEASKLIGREWKALSVSDKKPFEDRHLAERERYVEEYRSVYGSDPVFLQQQKRKTA